MGKIYLGENKIWDGDIVSHGWSILKYPLTLSPEANFSAKRDVNIFSPDGLPSLLTKTKSFIRYSIGSTDITTGKTGIASRGTTGPNVIDDNSGTEWAYWFSPSSGLVGEWVGVDLGEGGEKRVIGFSMTCSVYQWAGCAVDYSDDGLTWVQLGTASKTTASKETFYILTKEVPLARYWRVRCTSIVNGISFWLRVTELEFFEMLIIQEG